MVMMGNNRERDRSSMRGRWSGFVASLLVVSALLGACGGSSSTSKDTSSKGATAPSASDKGDSSSSNGKLVDPCSLVTTAQVEKIFGEPVDKPESKTTQMGEGSARSCLWQAKATVDSPKLDNVGRMLQLMVHGSPNPKAMSPAAFFQASSAAATGKADVCDKAFWLNGMLNALQGDVYLSASAGLSDDSPKAKAASLALMKLACAAL